MTAKVGIYTAEKKLIVTDEAIMEPQDSAETGESSGMGNLHGMIGTMMILAGCVIREKRRKTNGMI